MNTAQKLPDKLHWQNQKPQNQMPKCCGQKIVKCLGGLSNVKKMMGRTINCNSTCVIAKKTLSSCLLLNCYAYNLLCIQCN